MRLSLATALAYLAITHAAPVTVTSVQYVVATTRYTTLTINNAPPSTGVPATSTAQDETPSSAATTSTSSTSSVEATTSESSTKVATSTISTKATTSTTIAATLATAKATTTANPTTSSSSTTTTSTSSTSSSLNSFEASILAEHNKKRALHGVGDLTWNSELAEYAANYAASSFSCDNVKLIHSHGPYGENLAAGYVGGASPVDAWYNEISQYDYSNPGFSEATGHFTQVVWKSTTQVGCAMVSCDNEWRQYTICEYSPAGNVVSASTNYFELNVLPLV